MILILIQDKDHNNIIKSPYTPWTSIKIRNKDFNLEFSSEN